jgi:biopolymer transport protein ExbB
LDFSETGIVNATLWLLGLFSLITWSVILIKLWEWALNTFRNHAFIRQHAKTGNAENNSAIEGFDRTKSQFARVFHSGQMTAGQMPEQTRLNTESHLDAWHQLIERGLSQQIRKEKAKMDSGLGLLASFGSTSPFVGLFGTVWGIMHALQDISSKGSASLEVVAGPIGEALIATAIGIAVAIPAVLGYNFFIRLNKANLAKLNHFADDYLRATIQQDLQQQTGMNNGATNTR